VNRTIGIITIFVFVLLLILTVAVFGPSAAGAESPSPSPSPTVSASPAPEPASAALVRSARKAKRRAQAARKALSRVRSCFGSRGPIRVYPTPSRAATAEEWGKAQRRWRHQAKSWKAKTKAGVAKMRQPGGTSSGTRWKPLARYVGWPEHTLSHLAYIIMRESSGRARAYNPSGAAGLCQLMPGWYRGTWGARAGNPFDPEYNLRTALWIYQREGWAPWSL